MGGNLADLFPTPLLFLNQIFSILNSLLLILIAHNSSASVVVRHYDTSLPYLHSFTLYNTTAIFKDASFPLSIYPQAFLSCHAPDDPVLPTPGYYSSLTGHYRHTKTLDTPSLLHASFLSLDG